MVLQQIDKNGKMSPDLKLLNLKPFDDGILRKVLHARLLPVL
jgi:hypothetical protein